MIEEIDDMPTGAIGFRASGEITADDYRRVLEPALKDAAAEGEIRMLYVLDDGFDMSAGAMAQDAKVGLTIGAAHHSVWKRTAIVTDVELIAKSIGLFTWLTPGEVRVWTPAEIDSAKQWVAS